MTFEEFMQREVKYLNLGSLSNSHPLPHYFNYIGINPPGRFQNKIMNFETKKLVDHPDLNKGQKSVTANEKLSATIKPLPYTIYHDLYDRFPIPDSCVDRILSEDCFEHIEEDKYEQIFNEIYRILKPGGLFRLAVPDYAHPKISECLKLGYDPNNNLHITLTNYALMKKHLDNTKFDVEFIHHWNDGIFHQKKIDYKLGYVKRTPDNDPRNIENKPPYYKLRVTSLITDIKKQITDNHDSNYKQ